MLNTVKAFLFKSRKRKEIEVKVFEDVCFVRPLTPFYGEHKRWLRENAEEICGYHLFKPNDDYTCLCLVGTKDTGDHIAKLNSQGVIERYTTNQYDYKKTTKEFYKIPTKKLQEKENCVVEYGQRLYYTYSVYK